MPTVAGIKIKTKAPKVRNALFTDEKYTGSEPIWPEEASTWDDELFDHHLRKSFFYYNYYYSQKDTKKYVEEWAKKSGIFTQKELKIFSQNSDRSIPMTVCSLIMAHKVGMPLKEKHTDFIIDSIKKSISSDEVTESKTSAPKKVEKEEYKPNIQDRMQEKTAELIGELEGMYDEIVKNKKISFNPYDFLTVNKVVQTQLSKYVDVFGKRKAELELAQSKKDSQLTEAYKHYKAQDFKRLIAWIDLLFMAIDEYRQVKQATKKARVKKAPSKEKIVSKLKYAKDNKELKIVSINPVDIIGSSELWIYNTKTRKLGKYIAEAHSTLTIKGTSIEGFDTVKSVSKTIRKPAEKLKEFAKAGKIQLRKFMDEIKATETKLNGRISADIVLLKVS